MRGEGFLEVRVGGERFGLPLSQIEHVADLGEVLSVPSRVRAMRGVTNLRGRLVPLLHLGALLADCEPPATRGRTLVVARLGESRVALEVDDADAVRRAAIVAAPESRGAPWARGVVRRPDGLVPILDLAALGGPLIGQGAEGA